MWKPSVERTTRRLLFLSLIIFPWIVHASFIESTIGTAVVNDATASYHNPAALTLLKNPQVITLGSFATSRSRFAGQVTQLPVQFIQSGGSSSQVHYYLPSFYVSLPVSSKVTTGFAVLSNFFNRDLEDSSILRYNQSNNSVKNIDLVPGVGIKLSEELSLGAGINFSYAHFLLQPTTGFPSLNVPDSQSRNECSGNGWGGNVGFLLKPTSSMLIGFNYHSAVTYRLSGKSVLEGNPELISNNYHFDFWTPARSVLSISQFITPTFGLIATVQRIQWSLFQKVNIHGIATQVGARSTIVDADIPFYLHDAWLLTLGGHYRFSPKWIIRLAGTYNQSPGNSSYQLSNGDSFALGSSIAYELSKNVTVDGSYAHVFIKNQNIDIINARSLIAGVNKASRDAASLKLTFNFL